MKSIKLKLIITFTAVLALIIAGTVIFTINNITNLLMQDSHEHLIDMAGQEANFIEASVNADLQYMNALAQNQIISDANYSLDQQIVFFEAEAKKSGFHYFALSNRNGDTITLNSTRNTLNVGDRDYFQKALSGTPASSDLTFSKADGKPVLLFAAPIYQNGQITGVLYGRKDGLMLSDIVKDVQYKNTGYAYMINDQGTIVAHKDVEKVMVQENLIENMKKDSSQTALGQLTQKMITRDTGSADYTYEGVSKIVGYAPIDNTPWIVAFGVEKSDILTEVSRIQSMLRTIYIAAGIIGVLIIFFVSSSISRPIKKVTTAAQEIAHGHFDITLSIRSKDEVGQLAEAFNMTLKRLINYQAYIDEISASLSQIAQGNLMVVLKQEYVGQFQKLKDNLDALADGLSITLSDIYQASDQIYAGAAQVANGAQALSQGTTEQASSIEQLSASIAEVTEQIKQNSEHAAEAHNKAADAGKELMASDSQMREMTAAMNQINSKASEISKIIKIIDDIAFQTNILALNAAVEAARAGAAGKGFAVVADEVRNLAAKSAEAARNTSALIEETITAVGNGSSIAGKTADSLNKSAEGAMQVVSLIDQVAEASQNQASAIIQINQGIEQISSVVQMNAATAEESAAASQELSGQSSLLQQSIAKFTLRQGFHSSSLGRKEEDVFAIPIEGTDKY